MRRNAWDWIRGLALCLLAGGRRQRLEKALALERMRWGRHESSWVKARGGGSEASTPHALAMEARMP